MRVACAEERATPNVPGVVLDWRCPACGWLLGRYVPPIVYYQTKCPKCRALRVLATEARPAA